MVEISRIVAASGMPVYQHQRHGLLPAAFRVFDEDFFFFSQILVVNALAALPLVMRFDPHGEPGITLGIEGYFAYVAAVAFFACLWFVTRRAYESWGPANNWFPRA